MKKSRLIFALLSLSLLGVLSVELYYRYSYQALQPEEQLAALGMRYGLELEQISGEKQSVQQFASLLKASAIEGESESKEALLLQMKGQDAIFSLRSHKKLSRRELEQLMESYRESEAPIQHIEIDHELELEGEAVYWGAKSTSPSLELSSEKTSEEAVKIAVIDSGLDIDHEYIRKLSLASTWNVQEEDVDVTDNNGHGTHIAGIVGTYAKQAKLYPIKIYGEKGGKLSDAIQALDKAKEWEVDIVNMSFGIKEPSSILKEKIDEMEEAGIYVLAAAGNHGKSEGFYPAAYPYVLSVASVNSKGEKLPKSNYGSWVDMASLGYNVRSTLPGNLYGYKSGNSQSTAFASAALARFLQEENLLGESDTSSVIEAFLKTGALILEGDLAGRPIIR